MLPFCQPSGEFHGREDILSGSELVAQPAQPSAMAVSVIDSQSQRMEWDCGKLIRSTQ